MPIETLQEGKTKPPANEGVFVGLRVGPTVGLLVIGLRVKGLRVVGPTVGLCVGPVVGLLVGPVVGLRVGPTVGLRVGPVVVLLVDPTVGLHEGRAVGALLGCFIFVGLTEGDLLTDKVGAGRGAVLGIRDGDRVGAATAFGLPNGGAQACLGAPPPTPSAPLEAATVAYDAAFQLVTTDNLLKRIRKSLVKSFSFK